MILSYWPACRNETVKLYLSSHADLMIQELPVFHDVEVSADPSSTEIYAIELVEQVTFASARIRLYIFTFSRQTGSSNR